MIYPNLRAELARRNWSVEMLANATGIPKSTLDKRLYGLNDLKWNDAVAIKKALGVEMPLEKLLATKEAV